MARVVALLLFAAAALVQSVTSQDKLQGGNCIKVPTMCHDLIKNYTHMRLPNMLNQTRDTDVSADLNLWYPLLQSETCNAGNQLKYFLCFTYAPVCVDNDSVKKLIAPCRSVCQTVRYACEPVMRKNNYSWPEVFDCDKKHRFLDDASQMCISTMILNSMKRMYIDVLVCMYVCNNNKSSVLCRAVKKIQVEHVQKGPTLRAKCGCNDIII